MPDERWLPIVGYEGSYEVSDQGRVRSLARTVKCKATTRCPNGWSITIKPRLLTPNRSGSPCHPRCGHQAVCLSGEDGSQVHPQIHTLVLTAFVGPRPLGLQCRHLNGDSKDNRLINLIWGTAKENSADADRHGTRARGSRVGRAKLHENDIPIIRAAHAAGAKLREIALQYNVSDAAISCIILKKSWRHVPVTVANLDLFGNEQS